MTKEIRVEEKHEQDLINILKDLEHILRETGHGEIKVIISDNKITEIQSTVKRKRSLHKH